MKDLTRRREGAREMIVLLFGVGISLLVTPVVRGVAMRQGWVSRSIRPDGKHPAMLGGTAVLASVVLALLLILATGPVFLKATTAGAGVTS